jgi:hypothetical protein
VDKLTEGYDVPRVVRVAWAAPTASLVRWTQGCGRGFRPDASVAKQLLGNREDAPARRLIIEQSAKPYCSIVTYYPSNCKHQICAAVDLLGGSDLPPEVQQAAGQIQQETARQKGGSSVTEDLDTAKAFCDFRAALEEQRRHLKAKATIADNEYDGLGGQRQRLKDAPQNAALDPATVSWGGNPGDLSEKQLKWFRWKGVSDNVALSLTKWRAVVVRDLFEMGVKLETALGYPKRQALAVRDQMRARQQPSQQELPA